MKYCSTNLHFLGRNLFSYIRPCTFGTLLSRFDISFCAKRPARSHSLKTQGYAVKTRRRLAATKLPNTYEPRKIFSIFLPFANSSTHLSKYLTCCVKGSSISSTRDTHRLLR